ncbi:MAG: putative GTP-binding protein [Satyrvirus sp.]|uniref:Putative GTP-binding protein n=1 Tax=Satyrvirus sp. TaxID=2487771 RepID=A0A3G5AGD1_9VIRU|nr:MAG: putative GTP-binding protein [Satyrvirus sp.]
MDVESSTNVPIPIVELIKEKFPKLFVTEIRNDNLKFCPEPSLGHVEYKRTLIRCNKDKEEKYASQMKWRITENYQKQCAIYYIGVDDDGTIIGLSGDEIFDCVARFVSIAQSIKASVTGIQIIHINELSIIKIWVKMKKISNSYLVEFGDKF